MTTFFYRNGTEYTGPASKLKNVTAHRAEVYEHELCRRCGGPGGSQHWPGYTCYRCNNATPLMNGGRTDPKGPFKRVLYTAEKLAKLNAAQEKRNAKKAAAAAEFEAKRQAEHAAKIDGFKAEHADFLARLEKAAETDRFAGELLASILHHLHITSQQREAAENAITRASQREAAKAASTHQGEIGQRIKITVKESNRHNCGENAYGRGCYYIQTLADEQGNVYVYKGSSPIGFTNPYEATEHDEVTITATVKDHTEYKGLAQTVINRPRQQW